MKSINASFDVIAESHKNLLVRDLVDFDTHLGDQIPETFSGINRHFQAKPAKTN